MDDGVEEAGFAKTPAWRWLAQGARTAVFLPPDWSGLRATPAMLAGLTLANVTVSIGVQRLYIDGPASFAWHALGYGWLPAAVIAWACWMVARRRWPGAEPAIGAADAPSLFSLLVAQALVVNLALAAGAAMWPRLAPSAWRHAAPATRWTFFLLELSWAAAIQLRVGWSGSARASNGARNLMAALQVAMLVLACWVMRVGYWQASTARDAREVAARSDAADVASSAAVEPEAAASEPATLTLSQGVFESQQALLARRLDAVPAGRHGAIDLYAITFAPWAWQDVFMRESAVVADVMDTRFDARGGTLQLVNNVATLDRFPWATTQNLQRAIARVAQRMDRDEDILFLHLTSHGGRDAHLAAEFFPLTVDELTPQQLRRWLDEAGIRHRVISISACYSGSWVEPLADEDTLVMTAADADHTSYGCGGRSTLTFFGQAMYDEQLRTTWSFEQAHGAARKLIELREKKAGKDDGYSNPQIRMGRRMRAWLAVLESSLASTHAGKQKAASAP